MENLCSSDSFVQAIRHGFERLLTWDCGTVCAAYRAYLKPVDKS